MANIDAAFGFRPVKHMGGGVVRPSSSYTIADGHTTKIYKGDPVITTGTGRNINVGGTTVPLVGIFWGCKYTDAQGEPHWSEYYPGDATFVDITAYVFDDPLILFEAQVDEDLVAADIGQKADHAYTAGSTLTALSAAELDSSLITTSGQFKIVGLSPIVGNVYGNYAIAQCLIDEHENRATMNYT